jgi:protein phosphatase
MFTPQEQFPVARVDRSVGIPDVGLDAAGRSDPGRERSVNEDQWLIAQLGSEIRILGSGLENVEHSGHPSMLTGLLLAVADGLGGHAGGQHASQAALHGLLAAMGSVGLGSKLSEKMRPHDRQQTMRNIMDCCQAAVEATARKFPGEGHMGTTLTFALLAWPEIVVAHAGDCRCYLLHRGRLEVLTQDHSMAAELARAGQIAPEETRSSPLAHVLVNALGPGAHSHTDVIQRRLYPGDTVLLCSDGLPRHVEDDAIRDVLESSPSAGEACTRLIQAALDGGGTDNITCVVARLRAPEPAGPSRVAAAHALVPEQAMAMAAGTVAAGELAGPGRRANSEVARELPLLGVAAVIPAALFAPLPESASAIPADPVFLMSSLPAILAFAMMLALRARDRSSKGLARGPASGESGADTHRHLATPEQTPPLEIRRDVEQEALEWLRGLRSRLAEIKPLLMAREVHEDPHIPHRLASMEERLRETAGWLEHSGGLSWKLWNEARTSLTLAFENLRDAVLAVNATNGPGVAPETSRG